MNSTDANLEISTTCLSSLFHGLDVIHSDPWLEQKTCAVVTENLALNKYSIDFWSRHTVLALKESQDADSVNDIIHHLNGLDDKHKLIQPLCGLLGSEIFDEEFDTKMKELPQVLLPHPHLGYFILLWTEFEKLHAQQNFRNGLGIRLEHWIMYAQC